MVACTQFMNIIVHSVENVNYRVHLQYELTSLGLDDFLETLKDNESERLITQVLRVFWSFLRCLIFIESFGAFGDV